METRFYEFSQNNSGGTFVVDDKLCHRLYIEAETKNQAIRIAEDLGCYWDGCESGEDCTCCGDRWYRDPDIIDIKRLSKVYGEKFDSIEDYAQYLANTYGWTTPDARIFYLNKDVVDIKIQKKNDK